MKKATVTDRPPKGILRDSLKTPEPASTISPVKIPVCFSFYL